MGIIALLVAFLLPTLSRAREKAVRVQCMSNLRQRGVAVFAYMADNRGHPPHGSWGSGFNESLVLAQRDLLLNRYLNGNLRVWCCPSMPLIGWAVLPGGYMPCLPTQFPGGPNGEYAGGLLVADPWWYPPDQSPYFKDHLPRIPWTFAGWPGTYQLASNDRLSCVRGRWVLFAECYANWEGWVIDYWTGWTNNDLARHYSGKHQPAPYTDSPLPDGGSILFTDGSVAWTSKLYAWDRTHLIAEPERVDVRGL